MNADCFKLLTYEVQKYEFLTNPSYLAGWPLGLMTMSLVGGKMNQLTMSGHIQAEKSCAPEFSCISLQLSELISFKSNFYKRTTKYIDRLSYASFSLRSN